MRIPLHIKLMVSYLLVVSLVFLPTFVYLRIFQRQELHDRVAGELGREARAIGDRLGSTPPQRFDEVLRELVSLVPQRLTVLDPTGTVLADSASAGRQLPSHADRPEIRAALDTDAGSGVATRRSLTTGEVLLYSAVRFPATGPARGVVRLAVPTATLDSANASGSTFVNRAGAVALSAAVLLSLVAAIVVSRPLRRITDSARAFAAGDFGHPIDIQSDDELGDAALALGELAAQLRGRLLASGADRAALHALLDDLPVGVVLYDPRGSPVVISARARELCDLAPHQELERARQLIELEAQAPVVKAVLEDGFTAEAPLELPWKPNAGLRARWISIFAPDGDRQPALVVLDDQPQRTRLARQAQLLRRAAEKVRGAVRQVKNPLFATDLVLLADELDAELEVVPPAACDVRPVGLTELCEAAQGDLHAVAETGGVMIELSLAEPGARVVEADGRCRGAVRSLLAQAVRQAARGQVVTLRGELVDRRVRLSVRALQPAPNLVRLGQLVHCLGGDAGAQREGDGSVSWVDLPRA